MTPKFCCCAVAVMPVRSEPTHRAEQTTQLLFGEKAMVLEMNNKEWARIRCYWDGYEGWCKITQLMEVNTVDYKKTTKFVSATHKGRINLQGSEMQVPAGAELFNLKKSQVSTGFETGIFRGKKINTTKAIMDGEALVNFAKQYLNAPYLWGGRSLAGIDCSGLTQMAFKFCNYKLPRDARQQAEKGLLVDFLQNGTSGDLAFFDDAEGRIVHVGLLIDNQTIIHATDSSGKVVIDRIDQGGIISVSLKKRTHNLRFVKRIIGWDPNKKKAAPPVPQFLL